MVEPKSAWTYGNGARKAISHTAPAWLLILPLVVLIGAFYIAPLLRVFVLSVTEPELGLRNFDRVLTSRGSVRVLSTTLRMCAITTVITVALGFCVALAMTRVQGMHQRLLVVAVIMPLWISVLVRGLSWLVLLRDNGLVNGWLMSAGLVNEPVHFVNSELGVVIGMVHYLLPFGILPMFSVMQSIDSRLLFASQSLGASPATTFLKVYLPLALPGIFAATIMVFVFGLGFYVTPSLLGGGRVIMLAESVSSYVLTTARWGLGSAQAVVLLVLTLMLIGILSKTVGLKRGLG